MAAIHIDNGSGKPPADREYGLTWYAEGREGGLLVAKLARDRGSKAVGCEQTLKSSISSTLQQEWKLSSATDHKQLADTSET